MLDTKEYGNNMYYLVCTSKYAGQNINYSINFNNFEPIIALVEGTLVKINGFSDTLVGSNKKIKKLPLAVLDMITNQFNSVEELFDHTNKHIPTDDIIYNAYVGYNKNNYYAANEAIFGDKTLARIASAVRSKNHRSAESSRKMPVIDTLDELSRNWFYYLRNQLLNNPDMLKYYLDTANSGHFNRVDTHILDLLNEYHRYKRQAAISCNSDLSQNMDDCERDISRELITYKTFRTVYLAENKYRKEKETREELAKLEALNEEVKETEKVKKLIKTKNNKKVAPNQISLFDDDFGLKR